jgi:hypothetical protein
MFQAARVVNGLLALLAVSLPFAGCDSSAATVGSDRALAASAIPGPDRIQSPTNARPIDKTFDDIKFAMEQGTAFRREMLTPEIEALAGQRIRIRGYILPTAQSRGIKQFVLVRDNQECCFGPGAALYDCILVGMLPGKTAEFSVRPVTVEGSFRIEVVAGPDELPLAIYRLNAESVAR